MSRQPNRGESYAEADFQGSMVTSRTRLHGNETGGAKPAKMPGFGFISGPSEVVKCLLKPVEW